MMMAATCSAGKIFVAGPLNVVESSMQDSSDAALVSALKLVNRSFFKWFSRSCMPMHV